MLNLRARALGRQGEERDDVEGGREKPHWSSQLGWSWRNRVVLALFVITLLLGLRYAVEVLGKVGALMSKAEAKATYQPSVEFVGFGTCGALLFWDGRKCDSVLWEDPPVAELAEQERLVAEAVCEPCLGQLALLLAPSQAGRKAVARARADPFLYYRVRAGCAVQLGNEELDLASLRDAAQSSGAGLQAGRVGVGSIDSYFGFFLAFCPANGASGTVFREYESLPHAGAASGMIGASRLGPGGIHLSISYFKENLNWAFSQTTIPFTVCMKGTLSGVQSDCIVPVNKGGEAAAHMAFILRYWNNLPPWVAFADPNNPSWHQPFDKVAKLACVGNLIERGERIARSGFLGLNELRIASDNLCEWDFKHVWDNVVGPWLGTCPRHLVTDGSAQFLVSREAILRQPRALYESVLAYCLGFRRYPGDTTWQDAVHVSYSPGRTGRAANSYFTEYIWHLLFGETAVLDTGAQYKVCRMRPVSE
jgi:hypothetical protein